MYDRNWRHQIYKQDTVSVIMWHYIDILMPLVKTCDVNCHECEQRHSTHMLAWDAQTLLHLMHVHMFTGPKSSVSLETFIPASGCRNLHVTWELTVSDKSGLEATLELSWARFSETSATLCWSGGSCLPDQRHISTLQLYGIRRIPLNCPGLKKWDCLARWTVYQPPSSPHSEHSLSSARLVLPGLAGGPSWPR